MLIFSFAACENDDGGETPPEQFGMLGILNCCNKYFSCFGNALFRLIKYRLVVEKAFNLKIFLSKRFWRRFFSAE